MDIDSKDAVVEDNTNLDEIELAPWTSKSLTVPIPIVPINQRMFQAALDGNSLQLERLIGQHGGDPYLRDRNGCTLAHYSLMHRDSSRCVAILSEYASEILELSDSRGNQPLHYAALRGWTYSTKALLECAVNPLVANMKGRTALGLATGTGNQRLMQALYKYCNYRNDWVSLPGEINEGPTSEDRKLQRALQVSWEQRKSSKQKSKMFSRNQKNKMNDTSKPYKKVADKILSEGPAVCRLLSVWNAAIGRASSRPVTQRLNITQLAALHDWSTDDSDDVSDYDDSQETDTVQESNKRQLELQKERIAQEIKASQAEIQAIVSRNQKHTNKSNKDDSTETWGDVWSQLNDERYWEGGGEKSNLQQKSKVGEKDDAVSTNIPDSLLKVNQIIFVDYENIWYEATIIKLDKEGVTVSYTQDNSIEVIPSMDLIKRIYRESDDNISADKNENKNSSSTMVTGTVGEEDSIDVKQGGYLYLVRSQVRKCQWLWFKIVKNKDDEGQSLVTFSKSGKKRQFDLHTGFELLLGHSALVFRNQQFNDDNSTLPAPELCFALAFHPKSSSSSEKYKTIALAADSEAEAKVWIKELQALSASLIPNTIKATKNESSNTNRKNASHHKRSRFFVGPLPGEDGYNRRRRYRPHVIKSRLHESKNRKEEKAIRNIVGATHKLPNNVPPQPPTTTLIENAQRTTFFPPPPPPRATKTPPPPPPPQTIIHIQNTMGHSSSSSPPPPPPPPISNKIRQTQDFIKLWKSASGGKEIVTYLSSWRVSRLINSLCLSGLEYAVRPWSKPSAYDKGNSILPACLVGQKQQFNNGQNSIMWLMCEISNVKDQLDKVRIRCKSYSMMNSFHHESVHGSDVAFRALIEGIVVPLMLEEQTERKDDEDT